MNATFAPAFFNINTGQIGVDYFSETRQGDTEKTIGQRRIERMQEKWIQARYEAKMRSWQRLKESREFKRQYLADKADAYRVPSTALGKKLMLLFRPRLLEVTHRLVWLELWLANKYPEEMQKNNRLTRTNYWK